MLTVLSPAKTLDFDTPTASDAFSQPAHLAQSRKLIKRLRDFSADDLARLMKVSDGLAEQNRQRFRQWKTPFKPNNARQAIFAFKGDVYVGLDAYSMKPDDVEFAQDHLRILSGLYGLLRPLDLMQPYRLEMGTRLSTEAGSNLYQFWGDRITLALNRDLEESGSRTLVNLASGEYFKAVKPAGLEAGIVTPAFRDYRDGEYKFIQYYAKKARGLMARYIVDRRIDDPEGLKDFDYEGYRFNASLSNGDDWVFTRRQ